MRCLTRRLGACYISILISAGVSEAETVTFTNPTNNNLELHLRNGPIETHPDNRGSRNTTMKPSDVFQNDVGDGDTWFTYGNQVVNDNDNPPLCNAGAGQTITLDKSHSCYVNN